MAWFEESWTDQMMKRAGYLPDACDQEACDEEESESGFAISYQMNMPSGAAIAGIVVIRRNAPGEMQDRTCEQVSASSAMMSEALAMPMRMAVELAIEDNLQKVIIETDSLELHSDDGDWKIRPIVRDIR
ncbi:hypothetical protein CCACVL1_05974 [Corchorus capsularis]|uniref:Uncharacterized protein n=1 Tax=Corchorus capsularis TaxID=210143 RepID=A0A1R3JI79_COCAP|nr:hypothetical protein CCACVL1_05974 [Corchorus capsularis]